MPIYEYRCNECDHVFEELMTVDSRRRVTCPKCDATRVERQFSVFAAHGAQQPSSPSSGGGCGRCGDPNGPCGA